MPPVHLCASGNRQPPRLSREPPWEHGCPDRPGCSACTNPTPRHSRSTVTFLSREAHGQEPVPSHLRSTHTHVSGGRPRSRRGLPGAKPGHTLPWLAHSLTHVFTDKQRLSATSARPYAESDHASRPSAVTSRSARARGPRVGLGLPRGARGGGRRQGQQDKEAVGTGRLSLTPTVLVSPPARGRQGMAPGATVGAWGGARRRLSGAHIQCRAGGHDCGNGDTVLTIVPSVGGQLK